MRKTRTFYFRVPFSEIGVWAEYPGSGRPNVRRWFYVAKDNRGRDGTVQLWLGRLLLAQVPR